MLYQYADGRASLEDVQMGLTDLEGSLGELCMLCDNAGSQYSTDGRELGGLLRMLQCVAHTQRVNVDYLIEQKYKGKLKQA